MTRLPSTILLLTLVTGGCAATNTAAIATPARRVVTYHPFELETDLHEAALLAAARALAVELGAVEVRVDGCRLTAIIPIDKEVREQLVVEVKRGTLTLAYQTQIASGRGWSMPGEVCAGYRYAREGGLANRILAAVAIPNATVRR